MHDEWQDDELAEALAQRRAKLRAYADQLLEATIQLPMPETHLDSERAAKSVIATDRMLVVLFSKPVKPCAPRLKRESTPQNLKAKTKSSSELQNVAVCPEAYDEAYQEACDEADIAVELSDDEMEKWLDEVCEEANIHTFCENVSLDAIKHEAIIRDEGVALFEQYLKALKQPPNSPSQVSNYGNDP